MDLKPLPELHTDVFGGTTVDRVIGGTAQVPTYEEFQVFWPLLSAPDSALPIVPLEPGSAGRDVLSPPDEAANVVRLRPALEEPTRVLPTITRKAA